MLYLSLLLGLFLRYGSGYGDAIALHRLPFSILFLLWLFVFYITNLYELSALKNGPDFYNSYFRALVINAVLGIIFFYLAPFDISPRRNLFILLAVFTILDFGARWLFNRIVATGFQKPIVVVGANPATAALIHLLNDNPQYGYWVRAIFNPANSPLPENLGRATIISTVEDFKKLIGEEKIEALVISPEAYQIPHIVDLFYQLIPLRISFYNAVDFYELHSQKVILESINQAWFLENLSEGRKQLYDLAKRVSDVVLAIVLGLGLSPVLLLTAIAIRLETPGKILFKQTRVGRLGHKFSMYKFRTMVADAEKESGAVWASEDDPRITKVGRFLRRTRLDELPQLWNILKGEMSFVGPRAERPEFHKDLKGNIPFYEERYLIKPGLSGWAQIKYQYGSSIQDAAEKLQYDLYYIKHRSPALDMAILLKTLNIVLRRAGR